MINDSAKEVTFQPAANGGWARARGADSSGGDSQEIHYGKKTGCQLETVVRHRILISDIKIYGNNCDTKGVMC